jgi:uncharacterized protein DUF6298
MSVRGSGGGAAAVVGASAVVVGASAVVVAAVVGAIATAGELVLTGQPPIRGPLRVSRANPRYFETPAGAPVVLVGSHTWDNLQDVSHPGRPVSRFDYAGYLEFLDRNRHNFVRLWRHEQARWMVDAPADLIIAPHPWRRTGPGLALDGKPRFDLGRFDEEYFARLRQRVALAKEHGIYVSIMLFNGWSIEKRKGTASLANPWHGHPFHRANNVNDLDGDGNGDDSGEETHTLANPAVTAVQDAYVRKLIDTVNDLDNVLYEIANESSPASTEWQVHMIQLVKYYETTKPKQHPVGMTAEWPAGDDGVLFASPADWISPSGGPDEARALDPPPAGGEKVILADTDHLCGVCGDATWVWKSLLRGENPIFMDPYQGASGMVPEVDPAARRWVRLRANLGYALAYAQQLPLAAAAPRGELCSSGYCLAVPGPAASYLVLIPEGREVWVDTTAAPGSFDVAWLDVRSGTVAHGAAVRGGGRISLQAPFAGPTVLFLSR